MPNSRLIGKPPPELRCHAPRKRGIQSTRTAAGLLDRPLSRMMTAEYAASSSNPLDMRLDGLARVVDPAVRPGLFDHLVERLLPVGVLRHLGTAAERRLQHPGGFLVIKLGETVQRTSRVVDSGNLALDHHLEGAEVIRVFQGDVAVAVELDEHRAHPKVFSPPG